MQELTAEMILEALGSAKTKSPKVFLGGTCNESTWREKLIALLEIDYFNPVVPDWNDAAYQKELAERETADFNLYVLTAKMTGVYSIAEVVDDSNKRPTKTVLCVLPDDGDFDTPVKKSIDAVKKLVSGNGGQVFDTLEEVATFLNTTPIYTTEDSLILHYILRDLQLIKMGILAHTKLPQLALPYKPVEYPKDIRVVTHLNLLCQHCGSPLGDLRGNIQERFGTIEIEVHGYCLACQKSVFQHIRWHKDGHWSANIGGSGWVDMSFDPPTLWGRIKRFFSRNK